MPWDCGLLCLFTERRRHIEVLWQRRLLVTDDERRAKRRFLTLMRGFDTEDLDILRKAVESGGINIKQCAPGPPMDLIEEREESSSEEEPEPEMAPGCSTTIVSTRPRHSVKHMERDRILFQRQRVSTIASIQQQGGVSTVITQQISNDHLGNYQRRYSTNRLGAGGRRSSNFSRRCAIYTGVADENGNNSLRPTTIVRSRNSGKSTSSSDEGEITVDPDQPTTSSSRHQQPSESGGGAPLELINKEAQNSNADAGLIPQIDKPMSMPYLCCKMWRWKDLQVDAALHRLDPLPWCRFGRVTINNATVSCCNPYHYGLWLAETSSSEEQSISSGILANGGGTATGMLNETIMGDTTIGHVRSAFQHSLQKAAKTNKKEKGESPPATPPPAPPIGNSDLHTGNHLSASMASSRRISHSVHHQAMSWGRMARWQFNERVGEVVTLVGQFIVVGQLAGTVFDGQDIKTLWDLDNSTSFALIRQSSDATTENLDEVWLYNSSDQPLFMCVSRNFARASSSEAPNIRRLSPGYCTRVHRTTSGGGGNQQTGSGIISNQNAIAALEMGNDISVHRADSPIPVNPVSLLTISIGSGWGANYDQKSVANLHCRYEVIFT